jgi:hypothetical protein
MKRSDNEEDEPNWKELGVFLSTAIFQFRAEVVD